jgi:hypothetical protein
MSRLVKSNKTFSANLAKFSMMFSKVYAKWTFAATRAFRSTQARLAVQICRHLSFMPLGWDGYGLVGYAVHPTPGAGTDPNSSDERRGEVALVGEPEDPGDFHR